MTIKYVGNHGYGLCDSCGTNGKMFGPQLFDGVGLCRDCFIKSIVDYGTMDPEGAWTLKMWREWATANEEPLPSFLSGNS